MTAHLLLNKCGQNVGKFMREVREGIIFGCPGLPLGVCVFALFVVMA